MEIVIGSDHVGLELKLEIIKHLQELGYLVTDVGHDNLERTDYPIYGRKVAEAVAGGRFEKGIAICGSGVGISIAANKVNGIRAVVCSEPYSAKLSKEHNDTNVLAFGSRVVGIELAKMIVDVWLNAKYEGGRHDERIAMLKKIEERAEF